MQLGERNSLYTDSRTRNHSKPASYKDFKVMLFTSFNKETATFIRNTESQIAQLERQLEECRQNLGQLQQLQQAQMSATAAANNALEMARKARDMVAYAFGTKAIHEFNLALIDAVNETELNETELLEASVEISETTTEPTPNKPSNDDNSNSNETPIIDVKPIAEPTGEPVTEPINETVNESGNEPTIEVATKQSKKQRVSAIKLEVIEKYKVLFPTHNAKDDHILTPDFFRSVIRANTPFTFSERDLSQSGSEFWKLVLKALDSIQSNRQAKAKAA